MAESDRYTAVARRYRPQQFADLIGQEHVADALANAIRSGRVAHAYLFTGGRGMGKTTTARILAKALNCVHGPTPTPCDECDSCTAIMSGQDVDVVEIDAASNTGVDNIRDLKANVGFRPQHGRFKIYIVDEAHMLSNAAFNALLKTLEEPPPHVKFMLATTDVQKLPATILSRCQRFDFAAITPAKVQATLAHIAKREGIDADSEALAMLSRRAQGSMRDAQTLLDQLLGAVEGRLTPGDVERVLGLAAGDRLLGIADALVAGDARAALAGLTAATATGVQAPELIDQLVEHWRGLMLAHVAGPDSASEVQRAHAAKVSLDAVLAGIDLLVGAKTKLRSGVSAEVVAEVAVVRLARLADLVSVAQLVRQLQGLPDRAVAATPAAPVSGPAEEKKNAPPVAPPAPPSAPPKTPPPARPPAPYAPPVAAAYANPAPTPAGEDAPFPGPITPDTLPAIWEQVAETVGGVRRERLRLAGAPVLVNAHTILLKYPAECSLAYEGCAAEATLEVLRNVLRKLTGQDCQVRVELLPPDPKASSASKAARGPSGAVERTKDLMRLPLFAKASQVLGAQLLRVDDGFDPYRAAPVVEPATEVSGVPDESFAEAPAS